MRVTEYDDRSTEIWQMPDISTSLFSKILELTELNNDGKLSLFAEATISVSPHVSFSYQTVHQKSSSISEYHKLYI